MYAHCCICRSVLLNSFANHLIAVKTHLVILTARVKIGWNLVCEMHNKELVRIILVIKRKDNLGANIACSTTYHTTDIHRGTQQVISWTKQSSSRP